MVKPLLDYFGADKILSASMVTVHAATGSQEVLDRVPDAKTADLRKNRSILNNIILTSTGAAKALALVIPEMKRIGFIAESVRIPTSTGSLIVLVVNIQDESVEHPINRTTDQSGLSEGLRNLHAEVPPLQQPAERFLGHHRDSPGGGHHRGAGNPHPHGPYLHRSDQNPRAAQGSAGGLKGRNEEACVAEVPVTQTVVYGWYDNELGSYTNLLGDLTVKIAEEM